MMTVRSTWLAVIAQFITGFMAGQYINEFHYSNDGADQGEFIEVVIPGQQPGNLSEYRIELYNGSDSMIYDGRSLSGGNGITISCPMALCYYVWAKQPFIQNGPRDGIAFVRVTATDTTVYDFISYQGTLEAKGGPVKGMISTDIGVYEDDNTEVGWSLQRRSDGSWFAGPATKGSVNPIELLSFEGIYLREEGGVLLEWRAATELNNHYFEVQKSRDQRSFLPLAEVAGAGTSQQIREYSYFDRDVVAGENYYRLKQVDFGGKYAYSPVISVDIPSGNSWTELIPLARHGEIYFSRSAYRHPMQVTLYDVPGRKLLYQREVYAGDVIPFHFPLHGMVFYHLKSRSLSSSGRLVMINR